MRNRCSLPSLFTSVRITARTPILRTAIPRSDTTLLSINYCGCKIRNLRRCRAPSCRTHVGTSRYSGKRRENGLVGHHVFGFDMEKVSSGSATSTKWTFICFICSFPTDSLSKSNFGWIFSFHPPPDLLMLENDETRKSIVTQFSGVEVLDKV